MHRVLPHTAVFLLTGCLGYLAGKMATPPPQTSVAKPPALVANRQPSQKPKVEVKPLQSVGAGALEEAFTLFNKANAAELRAHALQLLANPAKCRDTSLWMLLLARWSTVDGPGMIKFAETIPQTERERVAELAWNAWGAAAPAAAAAASQNLPDAKIKALINGMAETDVRLAVKLSQQQPDAQFQLSNIAERIGSEPGLAKELRPGAVYDGSRMMLERAELDALASSDPEAALKLAKSVGNITSDPTPTTLAKIAHHDVAKAAELYSELPSNRSKALSAVSLAGTWAAQNQVEALQWVRSTLKGPVRQAALEKMAAVVGGQDPVAGLALLEETGWKPGLDFSTQRIGNVLMNEGGERQSAKELTQQLITRIAAQDPAAADQWMAKLPPAMQFKPQQPSSDK